MSILRLRTLTLKSKIGFGKFADLTVGDLLKRRNKSYLIWLYYNASNIAYNTEIMDVLDIFPEKQIPKPGKKPELYNDNIASSLSTFSALKRRSHDKKEKRMMRKNYQKGAERKWFNKSANAWKNQGH